MQRRMFRTLIQNKQWLALRDLANEMLAAPGLSVLDQAVAHDGLCLALSFLDQHGQAVGSGEIAAYLAKQAGDYDLLGEALYHSGIAYGRMRMLERAVERFEEFTQYLDHYVEARSLYPKVLLNQGIAYRWLHDFESAADKLAEAWALVENPFAPEVQPIRQDLVWTYMLDKRLGEVPQLLELGRRYVADHPEDQYARFDQMNDEARYAYLSGDLALAFDLASVVLQEGGSFPGIQAEAGLTIHYAALAKGMYKQALAVGFMVKIHAGKARREDLDAEVTRSMTETDLDHDGVLMRELLAEMGQIRSPMKARRH